MTRWHARNRDEIAACLGLVAELRANTLFCQVYGDGMALYESSFVPRSPLVAPGFDALETAVEEGHRLGIEVHAYMNVCSVYSGGLGPPGDPAHLVVAHPEWAVVDSTGRPDVDAVGTAGTQIFFCAEREGFRDYCVDVASEIVSEYEVDGVHLDYLRFPGGPPRCFCEAHRTNFLSRFGREPENGDPDFVAWRFRNITDLFADIYDAVVALRPEAKVSGSLVAPSRRYFQDGKQILEAGKLDIAVPLLYTGNLDLFAERARWFHENSGGRLVFAGLQVTDGELDAQVELSRSLGLEGHSVFTCSNLDISGRDALASLHSGAADLPPMPWKDHAADRVAPVISAVGAGGILASEATVLWHTDERTRGRVEYGTTAARGLEAGRDGFYFDHAVRLTGLLPATTYHYRVASEDASGNGSHSSTSTFRTTDPGPVEMIVDDGDDGFTTGGPWSRGSSAGGFGGDYLFSSDQPEETAFAEWRPFLPRTGLYEVAVWYVAGGNRVDNAPYTVVHAEGSETFTVDQQSGGQRWNILGSFRFTEGSPGHVRLSNEASGGDAVIADAVRFHLLETQRIFLRGDANADGTADISDAVAILGYLFLGDDAPECLDAADTDDSGRLDISDAVYLLNHLFTGGLAPPAPYPLAGKDPTPDALAEC